jgi:rRNA maturation protein Nop10
VKIAIIFFDKNGRVFIYLYPHQGPPMPYSFRYAVYNPLYHNNFGHEQSSDGRVTTGSYFVALPDGRLQTVNFKDEGYGFMAQVNYDGEARYHTGPGYAYGGGPYLGHSVPKLSEAQVAALMKIMVEAAEQEEAGKGHLGGVTESPAHPVTPIEALVAAEPVAAEPVAAEPVVPVEALVATEPAVPIEATEPSAPAASADVAEEEKAEPVSELDLQEAGEPAVYHPQGPLTPYRDIYAKYRRPYAAQYPAGPYSAPSPYGPYDRYAKYRALSPYPAGPTPDGPYDAGQYPAHSPYGPNDLYAKYRVPSAYPAGAYDAGQYPAPSPYGPYDQYAKYRQAYTTYNGEVYAVRPKRKHPKRSKRKQQARQADKAKKAAIKRMDEESEEFEDLEVQSTVDTEVLKVKDFFDQFQ